MAGTFVRSLCKLSSSTFLSTLHFTSSRGIAMSASTAIHANVIQYSKFVEENYENAIKTLNSLQSNAQTLAKARQNLEARRASEASLVQTIGALETLGLSLETLDTLNIIHVAGTKGKGMTCAFTESILRHAGLKTGFFSSPHLTAVRERIRINGKPLSTEEFAKSFFTVYNEVKHLKEPDAPFEMPHYFRFLLCMAFYTFLQEKVDAVILEVGIGGMFDSTNIIRKPVVVGISKLGLEHQSILGNTLEEIAIQKAGIMKEGVPAYTVATHPPHITDLLRSHAANVPCPFHVVSTLETNGASLDLGVDDGHVARVNASLAIHLVNEFLLKKRPTLLPSHSNNVCSAAELPHSNPRNFLPFHKDGLKFTKWDGRFQVFSVSDNLKYFLDGAHTIDSVSVALKWFHQVASEQSIRVLVFNVTGGRSPIEFLKLIANSGRFDIAIFCPVIAFSTKATPDTWSCLDTQKNYMEECKELINTWKHLEPNSIGVVCDSAESTTGHIESLLRNIPNKTGLIKSRNPHIDVLVTGSLHLVGTFLSVLESNGNAD